MGANLTAAENLAHAIRQVARKARSEHTNWRQQGTRLVWRQWKRRWTRWRRSCGASRIGSWRRYGGRWRSWVREILRR
jgi:hypothetical protein